MLSIVKHFNIIICSIDFQVNHYRQAAENASSDLAAEKVKTDTLNEEVCHELSYEQICSKLLVIMPQQ